VSGYCKKLLPSHQICSSHLTAMWFLKTLFLLTRWAYFFFVALVPTPAPLPPSWPLTLFCPGRFSHPSSSHQPCCLSTPMSFSFHPSIHPCTHAYMHANGDGPIALEKAVSTRSTATKPPCCPSRIFHFQPMRFRFHVRATLVIGTPEGKHGGCRRTTSKGGETLCGHRRGARVG